MEEFNTKPRVYLLQSVYSSLLVTPLGGGRKCQPSRDPAETQPGLILNCQEFSSQTATAQGSTSLSINPRCIWTQAKLSLPKLILQSLTNSFRARIVKASFKPSAEQSRLEQSPLVNKQKLLPPNPVTTEIILPQTVGLITTVKPLFCSLPAMQR